MHAAEVKRLNAIATGAAGAAALRQAAVSFRWHHVDACGKHRIELKGVKCGPPHPPVEQQIGYEVEKWLLKAADELEKI